MDGELSESSTVHKGAHLSYASPLPQEGYNYSLSWTTITFSYHLLPKWGKVGAGRLRQQYLLGISPCPRTHRCPIQICTVRVKSDLQSVTLGSHGQQVHQALFSRRCFQPTQKVWLPKKELNYYLIFIQHRLSCCPPCLVLTGTYVLRGEDGETKLTNFSSQVNDRRTYTHTASLLSVLQTLKEN